MSNTLGRECRHCNTTIEDDDLAYRVVYGGFSDIREDNIAEKVAGRAGEELDDGAIERWWCFECYLEERKREKATRYQYEDADGLWAILEAANGRLVADAKPMTVGGRGWFRVVDGRVQARHSVMVRGGPDDDWNVKFETEPTEDFDTADFGAFFDDADDDFRVVYLKPAEETPFVAGQNRTLGGDYDDE